jgi:TonB family protein
MRLKLVIASVVLHVVVALVLWAQSIWQIDQLDRGPDRLANLAVFDLPAPAAGNPHPKPQPEFVHKPPTHVTHDTVQPTVRTEPKPAIEAPPGDDKPGDTDTPVEGKCENPPCGLDEKKEPEKKPDPPPPPVVKKPTIVKPSDLSQIRIYGDTQVHPSEVDKMAIIRAGDRGTWAKFLVCIDDHGAVSSVKLVHSSGYSDYDTRLAASIRGWRYRPYMQGGEPQAVCSTVQFDYRM